MISQQSYSFVLLLIAISIVFQNNGVVDAYDWSCNLFCYNKGSCRHGHGKFGAYAGIDSQTEELPFETELHDNGMYCTCPVGYTGLQCEIKYVTCGPESHTCFNGSSCIKERSSDNGKIFYRCECDVKESVMEAPYAGKYCEHIATTFCDAEKSSFCTNGGRCKNRNPASATKQVGCDCPDGWEGEHCEMQVYPTLTEELYELEETLSANDIVWIIIGSILGIFVIIYFRRYHMIKKKAKSSNRRGRKNQEMGSNSRDGTRDII